MGGHRSEPADNPPVLIQVVEEDPLLASRMLASLRRDGFMVEVYSVPRADDVAGGGPRPGARPAPAYGRASWWRPLGE